MPQSVKLANAIFVSMSLTLGSVPAAVAQGAPECAGPSTGYSGCEYEASVFRYLAPQLAGLVSAGSPTPTRGAALGGFGRYDIGLAAGGIGGSLPEVRNYNSQLPPPSFATKSQTFVIPTVVAAVGLYGGYALGVTRVGAIDLLVDARHFRTIVGGGMHIGPRNTSLALGYGARIGLLEEGLLTPGIGLAVTRRSLPDVSATGGANGGFSGPTGPGINITGFSTRTTGWRLTASKSLIAFGASVAAGQDSYRSGATIFGGTHDVSQHLTRSSYSASLWTTVFGAKLFAEFGAISSAHVPTSVPFSHTRAGAARGFGSVGLYVTR